MTQSDPTHRRLALVTGASSGIGRALATAPGSDDEEHSSVVRDLVTRLEP